MFSLTSSSPWRAGLFYLPFLPLSKGSSWGVASLCPGAQLRRTHPGRWKGGRIDVPPGPAFTSEGGMVGMEAVPSPLGLAPVQCARLWNGSRVHFPRAAGIWIKADVRRGNLRALGDSGSTGPGVCQSESPRATQLCAPDRARRQGPASDSTAPLSPGEGGHTAAVLLHAWPASRLLSSILHCPTSIDC
ncbi:hypothetical protein AAFF_G00058080 [Aldrovandia affinis]|uniref:Uncharacterized protein n=1 Tax=Aldrovandia affinis TaxID=143900 RepID=A0AAD7S0A6_9TELE|nr:hypothetical protein AAFF_G00058080 [Aldrovandia affinis]